MLISFIVLSLNREKTIERTIQSILCQNDFNFEIIVCDGKSTDGTEIIVKKYKSVRFLSCSIRSPAAQSEYAIKQAHGDYVAFVDSDDFIDSSYCKAVWPILEEKKPDILTFNFYSVNKGAIKKYRQSKKLKAGFYTGDNYKKILSDIYGCIGSISRCSKIVKRELAESACKYYNSSVRHLIWEDTFYTYPLFLMAKNVCVSNCFLYYYVVNDSSITRTIRYDLGILGELEEIFDCQNNIFQSLGHIEQSKQTLTFSLMTILALLKNKAQSLDKKSFLSLANNLVESKFGSMVINEKVRTTNYSFFDKFYAFLFRKRLFNTFRVLYRIQCKVF